MAKRKRAATAQVVRYVQPPARQPAQIIQIRSNPARSPARTSSRTHTKHRRRTSSGGGGRSAISGAIGGAVYGFLEKSFPAFPTIPMLGRAGTIAVVGHFLSKRGGMGAKGIVRDVTFAAAVIAGYELGKDGKISGDLDGEIPAQVRGLASQV
jgi:hypothetical protein